MASGRPSAPGVAAAMRGARAAVNAAAAAPALCAEDCGRGSLFNASFDEFHVLLVRDEDLSDEFARTVAPLA